MSIPTDLGCILHEDTFYAFFVPYRHPEARYDIWGGYGLETFGEDFQLARRLDPTHIWTVMDGGDGRDQWIAPGIHYVNRICYLATEIPHNWINVDFRVDHRLTTLTPLGLERQLRKLERLRQG